MYSDMLTLLSLQNKIVVACLFFWKSNVGLEIAQISNPTILKTMLLFSVPCCSFYMCNYFRWACPQNQSKTSKSNVKNNDFPFPFPFSYILPVLRISYPISQSPIPNPQPKKSNPKSHITLNTNKRQ